LSSASFLESHALRAPVLAPGTSRRALERLPTPEGAQFALEAAPGTMVAVWHTLQWTGEDRWREFFPANVEQQL
jgi:hypothetical protein